MSNMEYTVKFEDLSTKAQTEIVDKLKADAMSDICKSIQNSLNPVNECMETIGYSPYTTNGIGNLNLDEFLAALHSPKAAVYTHEYMEPEEVEEVEELPSAPELDDEQARKTERLIMNQATGRYAEKYGDKLPYPPTLDDASPELSPLIRDAFDPTWMNERRSELIYKAENYGATKIPGKFRTEYFHAIEITNMILQCKVKSQIRASVSNGGAGAGELTYKMVMDNVFPGITTSDLKGIVRSETVQSGVKGKQVRDRKAEGVRQANAKLVAAGPPTFEHTSMHSAIYPLIVQYFTNEYQYLLKYSVPVHDANKHLASRMYTQLRLDGVDSVTAKRRVRSHSSAFKKAFANKDVSRLENLL